MAAIRLFSTVIICFLNVYALEALTCQSGWVRHEDVCYHFSHDPEPWPGAESMCRFFGGHLAEIRSYSENNFIRIHADNSNRKLWLGGTDWQTEGEWKWVGTGNVLHYRNWHSGEPNNDSGLDNCMQIYEDGTWDDANCEASHYYVCEERAENPSFVG